MSVSVLVVDDSGFFRKRVCEILNSVSEINIVGTASNGRDAIDLVKKLKPDVVTMDYEMPVMDGVTAVRNIMHESPTPILMFSSLTYEGARVTLDALEAGAVDFLPKNFEDIAKDAGKMQEVLKQRILSIAKKTTPQSPKASTSSAKSSVLSASKREAIQPQQNESGHHKLSRTNRLGVSTGKTNPHIQSAKPKEAVQTRRVKESSAMERVGATAKKEGSFKINHPVEIVVIGASTGGPVALQKVLSRIPQNFPVPVLVVQHMPSSFTPAFAERLNTICQVKVEHAVNGMPLKKGVVVVAPGGKQMIVNPKNMALTILDGDARLTYKPSVDVTFGSVAKAFPGKALGVVLTGMGSDGREGCRLLKQSGSSVITQNEQSCVIYGMPMAVDKAGYSDASLDISKIGDAIVTGVQ